MRILSVNAIGIIRGGATRVFIHGNQLLSGQDHVVAWLTIGAAPFAQQDNQSVYCIPEFRESNQLRKQIGLAVGYIYNPGVYKLAERAVREFRPDVVHVHNIQGQLSPSVLIPFKKHAIPVVQTLHDYRLMCPAIYFLSKGQVCEACKGKRYYHCALKRCRKGRLLRSCVAAFGSYFSDYFYQYDQLISSYIAPSEFMRQKLVEFGYAAEKIHMLPNAYFGQLSGSTGAKREHIFFAGRLNKEKGVDLLVRAAKNLDITVNIAGDGPERETLQALARETEARNVRFLGFLDAGELNRLYQTAIVTVLPSRWYENGPLVLLESYANATPVVGARIGAIPEFVEEGKTGFLFTPNDVADLHRVLQHCITHPESINGMGEIAHSCVQAKYSPAAYAKGLEDILNSAVKQEAHENCRN